MDLKNLISYEVFSKWFQHGIMIIVNHFFSVWVTEDSSLTLFVPGYFIPTVDQGCAVLRTPYKILTRATAVLKLLQHLY